MWQDHPRYYEIGLEAGSGATSLHEDGPLKIVLFRRAAKLRSHAVKHLTNLSQYENTWKRMGCVDMSLIRRCISDLETAGCPYFQFNPENPPCDDGRAGCRLFERCPSSVKELEKAYCQTLVQCLSEGGHVPRYAYYFCDNEQAHMFCIMPDAPLVLKASLLPDEEIYNLMTCYGSEGMSFTEMRDIQVEKIRNEARTKNTDMCSLAGWGLEEARACQARQHTEGRNEKGRKSRRPQKYHKRGGGDWRKYLNKYDDLWQ
ncbi:MAG: hypothetical protein JEZ02_04745 [Desulfatibacillum sp.]|nr:hypothetical protein [Desulfatibacillum sp.]